MWIMTKGMTAQKCTSVSLNRPFNGTQTVSTHWQWLSRTLFMMSVRATGLSLQPKRWLLTIVSSIKNVTYITNCSAFGFEKYSRMELQTKTKYCPCHLVVYVSKWALWPCVLWPLFWEVAISMVVAGRHRWKPWDLDHSHEALTLPGWREGKAIKCYRFMVI